jgi:DNA modification methylase
MNKIILGDNLEILKNTDSESVDLVYLDPPFFSNRTYEVIWGDKGEVRSFEDRFSGGIDHYIAWLKERVIEMHRILKPTGSIFLHCDWHADAYIRVDILDKIFGLNNFRSEITWKRSSAHNDTKQGRTQLGNIRDSIYYYTKSKEYTFNTLFTPYEKEYIDSFYKNADEDGRKYTLSDLTGPGGASKGNPFYEFLGVSRYWQFSKENMKKLYDEGLIVQTKPGNVPRRKRYLDETPGVALQDIWMDVKPVQSQSKEKIGYPTQKPEALLDRIIRMASNEGDIIMDPFVGGGTTVAVAEKLNRNWIGIDQSVQAVKVTEMRLNNQQDLFSKPFMVQLHKYDYDTLRYKDAFEFETFIVTAYGGRTNTKQRGDLGLDGKTLDNVPIQVKRSDGIGRNVIDNFHSAIQRYDKALYEKNKKENKEVGFIIAFSFGKGAIEEVARLKNKEGITIKLITVEEIIPIAKKPTLSVNVEDKGKDAKGLHELNFTATANSEAGIEFYSWDFDYDETKKQFKPEILLDKIGAQSFKFKAGLHHIAVKVFDNDGLENIEVIKLKVNGKVEVN